MYFFFTQRCDFFNIEKEAKSTTFFAKKGNL